MDASKNLDWKQLRPRRSESVRAVWGALSRITRRGCRWRSWFKLFAWPSAVFSAALCFKFLEAIMKHIFCFAVSSFSCLIEAALFSNSSHSISQSYGDSELPSRTTATPSGTVDGPASVLSSIDGPSMWAISYTWVRLPENDPRAAG